MRSHTSIIYYLLIIIFKFNCKLLILPFLQTSASLDTKRILYLHAVVIKSSHSLSHFWWASCYIKCSICSPCCGNAGRPTQAGDGIDQWRDRWNAHAPTVYPTQWRLPASAGWLSWIVDVDRPFVEGQPKQRSLSLFIAYSDWSVAVPTTRRLAVICFPPGGVNTKVHWFDVVCDHS